MHKIGKVPKILQMKQLSLKCYKVLIICIASRTLETKVQNQGMHKIGKVPKILQMKQLSLKCYKVLIICIAKRTLEI